MDNSSLLSHARTVATFPSPLTPSSRCLSPSPDLSKCKLIMFPRTCLKRKKGKWWRSKSQQSAFPWTNQAPSLTWRDLLLNCWRKMSQKTKLWLLDFHEEMSHWARFKDSQSCQDIDQIFKWHSHLRSQKTPQVWSLLNSSLLRSSSWSWLDMGRSYSGDTISKILPRYEYFNQKMTMLEIKRYIYQKISSVFKEGAKRVAND